LRLRDVKLKTRLDDSLESLATDPRPPGWRKLAGISDRYRIRVGDYRMIYSVDDGKVTVLVLAIGHRREVYERL
jgi:mRNA interferase RelE/StbE